MSHSPSESASTAPVRVAVDVGGTFTDIVLEQEPRRWSAKLLTTPDAPETAVLQGIEELLGQAGLAWPRVDLLILGTTLATNALIERKGARTALLTTAGFRDLVEIGLEDRFAQYDIFLDKPEPLVPRPWRHGVTERVDAHGQVLTPLDEAQVVALAGELTRAGIESVAVCLLHSYAHPGHERRIRELLKQHAPQLWVSLSSDVCAEIREYPRLSTVSANAYVQPQVSGYLRRLNEAARQRGLRDEPFLMTSGGAIATLQTGIDEPVRLVESGPAGGAIARVNHLGVVQVGPDSAGSSPGPAAYGNGGELPTVTDAHALIGTVTPERFAVGKVGLRPELARQAIQAHLAGPAGLDAPQAAQAIIEVVSENMANAARVHASELGKAAEEHTLIAFGGAAPLHAAGLARKLGIGRVIIPESAGVGSAVGFLWAPIAYQAVRSFHQRLADIDHGAVQRLLDELTAGVDTVVRRAAPHAPLHHKRVVFMRYSGQGHEIAVELPDGPFDAAASARLGAAFAERYAQLYGRSLPHVAPEAVSWSVAAQAGERRARPRDHIASGPATAARQAGTRRLYDFDRNDWIEVPTYERQALDAEQKLAGPALVVEDETTTFVPAGFEARRSRLGSLVLDDIKAAAARAAKDPA
ncbi:hydantoinase/oxoprolinase family protein [Achromobacter insuavis]|uniref:hydantoinase/oxoprolinase family protein n=1 Tax=Achromobacter insuavis TaxID=1287735 RepID=UPI001F12DF2A|nr:hydantoinase/oxoprolinase family protein [Achromobacter insuavis]